MATPRQVGPDRSPASSPGANGPGGPHRASIGQLRATLEALIADGDRCCVRLAAVNPETGQYRVVLRERWAPGAGAGHPRPPARKGASSPEGRARRFTIRDLFGLELAESPGDSVRSRIAAMLHDSRSVGVQLEDVDPESGDIRIVLQGTLGGATAGAVTEPAPDSDPQDVTRKLKSLIKAATRSS